MSNTPMEALEGALRSIDASLSILVVARENIILRMELLDAGAETPPPGPAGACTHPADQRLEAGNGGGVCGVCGLDVSENGMAGL